jgi:uncharacterized protein (TIGR00299 family) protein
MSKLLYFDTFNGVAGDMIIGALLDMGLPLDHLRAELASLGLGAYELHADPVVRQGLRGIDFRVVTLIAGGPEAHAHAHGEHGGGHHHGHGHKRETHGQDRGLAEIERLIQSSRLSARVQERACRIFRRLGEAEALAHGTPVEQVHFHEVGAVDSIVDIVGACIGFDYFGVDEFYAGPLNLGGGTVTFSHGTWPVPTPATAELVKGFPTVLGSASVELTTPTGAAIVTSLAKPGARPPVVTYTRRGLGAGDREMAEIPNMLRLMLGETLPAADQVGNVSSDAEVEEIVTLEASIDDMDGQAFGHFMELALERGALDVYYTPIQMKKNRPAVLLTLLCRTTDHHDMVGLIFRETTTLGVRSTTSRRFVLGREAREVETEYGRVRVKIARLGGQVVNVRPEYEDLKALAEKTGLPLKTIRDAVARETEKRRDYE